MDLNRDGILDTTAWVAAQDGLLVHDIYGEASVRENSQFAFARHGGETDLQGLAAQFDSNNDGVLDAKDSQFGEFAVWQDTDQDGVADAGEVKHLIDLGITSIQLHSDGMVRTPASGVTEAGHTTAQLANGSKMLVSDAAFAYTLGSAEVSVIPASEPGSMDPGSSSGVTSAVIPAEGSVIPASEPGSTNPVIAFTLNASDVLATPTDASGKHTVHVNGDSNDTLNLSNLLGTGAAPGTWAASGAVQENGQSFNSYTYSADPSLQVLVDNQLQHVTLS
jgi:hypothetical protein